MITTRVAFFTTRFVQDLDCFYPINNLFVVGYSTNFTLLRVRPTVQWNCNLTIKFLHITENRIFQIQKYNQQDALYHLTTVRLVHGCCYILIAQTCAPYNNSPNVHSIERWIIYMKTARERRIDHHHIKQESLTFSYQQTTNRCYRSEQTQLDTAHRTRVLCVCKKFVRGQRKIHVWNNFFLVN